MAKDEDRYEDDLDDDKPETTRRKPRRKDTNFNPEAVGDYDVGYGRPPQHSVIKKGEKRNPKGRPKGAKNKPRRDLRIIDKIIDDSKKLVPIKNSRRKLRRSDAAVEMISTSALKGNTRSLHKYVDLLINAEKVKQASSAREFELALAYKNRCLAEIARCDEEGFPPPRFLPHPDDIHFDFENQTFEVHGPATPDQLAWATHWSGLNAWAELEHLSLLDELAELATNPGDSGPEAFRMLSDELASNQKVLIACRKALSCPWATTMPRFQPDLEVLKAIAEKSKKRKAS